MKENGRDRLFEVADRQQGYFTAQQAQECGFHRSHFHRFVGSGEWIKEQRGICRLARYPVLDRPELVLWTLWSRNKQGEPQGVWSHETALDIHELTDVMPARMHMTVPKSFRRSQQPSVIILYRQNLVEKDVEVRQGYRVTKPLRTLIDVIESESISWDQAEQGVKEALRRGLISKQEIQREPEAQKLLKLVNDKTI